jgi:thiosulfate/3-mercaptopyruvate sulfurtransferase
VTVPQDLSPELAGYAHPDRLVTTQWLEDNLDTPGLAIVESNEDVLLYETGHIPGAIKVDWHTELNDPVVRDYLGWTSVR